MKIIQLSDIHLSNSNLTNLQNYFMEALLSDLKAEHLKKPIDVIIFTGDLVDKGGDSLGTDPYQIFEQEVISRLALGLGISNSQILMIPGNHDIERQKVEKHSEYYLAEKLDKDMANTYLNDMKDEFNTYNERIKLFKNFEKKFHLSTPDYFYSNNESVAILSDGENKVGLVMINDSWRCSVDLKKEQHFIGINQLFNAKKRFAAQHTKLNIALFHHPLEAINSAEAEEIEAILKAQDFHVAFFGHSHKYRAESVHSANGGFLTINGRSAFNNSKEISSVFQPGYIVLDVDVDHQTYEIQARKFILNGYRFDKDTDSLPNGCHSGKLPIKNRYYELAEQSNNDDKNLPDSYTADVDRIVKLLIGKSLYPNPYIFIRELIQNSVDACNRVKQVHTHLSPKIIISLNTTENYIEVLDEGDGMSKEVLKNHFSVIGKSISQEFNDNTGNFSLISKFGIGFISTFIVADKIQISTKHEMDEQVTFKIKNVFKGFEYSQSNLENRLQTTGTIVRIYLKQGYIPQVAFSQAMHYCRHIANLECYQNGSRVQKHESWNIESCLYTEVQTNDRYELKLGLSPHAINLIASNSGFIITDLPLPIIPYKFPYIIGGEINFKPGGIDFDVSRSNVMPSEKASACQKEISILLRKFFRQALESEGSNIKQVVVSYLQHYLQFYEQDKQQMYATYADFYSKNELLDLCAKNTMVVYQSIQMSLASAISTMKLLKLDTIFTTNQVGLNDYQIILKQYLENKGFIVVRNQTISVQLRHAAPQGSLDQVLRLIGEIHGVLVKDLSAVDSSFLVDMKMDKKQFPESLVKCIKKIEEIYRLSVEIGPFNKHNKPSVANGKDYFLNYDHDSFQSMLNQQTELQGEILYTYLLGLLGLKLQ
ncbi:metallophosphoesterase [Pedobacter jeongneungensis]|uniref:metallophosphoesterase n=1 Tax=Pedobacter jeongneungensis TaxID=947309 RepID=UPI00046A952D|nr:metallophosphoesterase [Pedobacter jeongneungensis]